MPDPTGRISHLPDFHRGVSWKQPCRVATTANVTISTALNNGDTIDGMTLATGDRVLVKNQATGSQNGIYVVGASPARAFDMDQDATTSVPAEETLGAFIYVIAGTTNGGKVFYCTNTSAPTLGTTSLTFAEFTTGGGASIDATDGTTTVSAPDTIEITGAGGIDVSVSESPSGTAAFVVDGSGITGGGGSAKYPFDTNFFAETKPGSPNATYDDEFDDTSGMSGSGNGLAAKWNWRNQSTSTITYPKAGWGTISIPASGSASYRIIEIAALADGTYETRISMEATGASGDAGGGIVLVDGTNGDLYVFVLVDTGGNFGFYLQSWTSVSAFGATVASRGAEHPNFAYLRVTKSGTAITAWYSFDGIGWFRLASFTDGVGATRIGLGCYETKNTGLTKLHVDYFRKTA